MGTRGAVLDPLDVQGRGLYLEFQGVADFELACSVGRIVECTEGFPRKVWYRESIDEGQPR